MNQERLEEEEKERKRDRKDRGQEADGKKGSPTKQKHIGGTKTRPICTAQVTRLGRNALILSPITKWVSTYEMNLDFIFH